MKINEKLLKLRKEKGLSQEELANVLNVSRQSISKWELGDTTPELNKVVEIAKYYKVSTDYLLLENKIEPITNENIKENDKDTIVNLVLFTIGVLLLSVSIIITQIIPHDTNTSHSGLIAYIFEDWTFWGMTWRFLMFIPGLVLLFKALINYLKGKKT
ncbi:MAG: helix-turn-helix domain-containing protein [Candidatus Izemoplasmatales bacterium]